MRMTLGRVGGARPSILEMSTVLPKRRDGFGIIKVNHVLDSGVEMIQ